MKKLTETLFVMFMTILACSCGGTKQAGEPRQWEWQCPIRLQAPSPMP